MRRILKCLLAALLIAMVLMLSAAQADDGTAWIDEPCPVGEGGIHKDHWERVQIGDCTHDDIEIYSCEYCGKSHTYTYPAPGHQWDEGKVTKEATCTEAGERTYTCTRLVINAACGEKRTETIPALGHSWDGGVVTTAPTCTTAGVRTYTCSRCGTTTTEAIPATGHTAVTLPAVAATCTAGGKTEGSKCSVCGAILTAQQDTPALGHSWDEGQQTQEAGLMVPGRVTHTCTRCGQTRTEETPLVEAGGPAPFDLFALIRHNPDSNTDGDPLRIDTHPQDGKVGRGSQNGYELFVDVSGGVPPYTFEWYYRTITHTGRISAKGAASSGKTSALLECIGSAWTTASSDIYAGAAAGRSASMGLYDAAAAGGVVQTMKKSNRYQVYEPDDTFGLPGQRIPGADGSLYTAFEGGREYYCVVRDQAGNRVTSKSAAVVWGLEFFVQPGNHNLETEDGKVFLYAQARGGSGEYYYEWYRGNGTRIPESEDVHENFCAVTEPGEYYCVAYDLPDSVKSETAVVYSAEPLTVTLPDHVDLKEGDSAELAPEVRGGVEPYQYSWAYCDAPEDSGLLFFDETGCGTDERITVDSSGLGAYQVIVTDAVNEKTSAVVRVRRDRLQISRQPEGGTLTEENKKIPLDVTVADGKAPFYYQLWRDGEQEEPDESYDSDSPDGHFDISETGVYAILVRDSEGYEAFSDWVQVDSSGFRVKYYTPLAHCYSFHAAEKNLDSGEKLRVEVEGGTPPYTYEWYKVVCDSIFEAHFEKVKDYYKFVTNDDFFESYIFTLEPYTYWHCRVTDAEGQVATVCPMKVDYAGSELYIYQQPQDVTFPFGEELRHFRMGCGAYSNVNHPVEYMWQQKTENGWVDIKNGPRFTLSESVTDTFRYVLRQSTYRCRVTDTVTGEAVYSREAKTHAPPLEVTAEQVSTSGTVILRILGGEGPYSVSCVKWRRVHIFADPWRMSWDYDLSSNIASMQGDGFHWIEYTYTDMDIVNKGWETLGYSYCEYKYKFCVCDATGERAEFELWMDSGIDGAK